MGDFCVESSMKGHTGDIALKMSVKLHIKGIEKLESQIKGSQGTQYFVRKAGQLIYGKQNFFNGAIAVIPDAFNNYETTKDIPAFDIDKNTDVYFIFDYIARPCYYEPVEALTTGTGSKRLHQQDFYELPISLPTKVEQLKISSLLQIIDNLITLHQRK